MNNVVTKVSNQIRQHVNDELAVKRMAKKVAEEVEFFSIGTTFDPHVEISGDCVIVLFGPRDFQFEMNGSLLGSGMTI